MKYELTHDDGLATLRAFSEAASAECVEARVDSAGRVRVFMNEQAAREWLGSCALPKTSDLQPGDE